MEASGKRKNRVQVSLEKYAAQAGMSVEEWKRAAKFDRVDRGWIIMSIGMAIGAGIVFLPVKVGLMGLWAFLISAVIAYPTLYLFQRLFINTIATAEHYDNYPNVVGRYLGRGWGFFIGCLYFIMLVIWMFVYSTALTNDSASFLVSFHVTQTLLSDNPFYGLIIICILVAVASRAEKLLFRISTFMVLTKLFVVLILGILMIGFWSAANMGPLPNLQDLVTQTIILLPFTLTSILFLPSLSPMVISFRSHNKNIQVARYKSIRAMNIAFIILFVVVFFYAVSFNLALGHDQALEAYQKNVSTLAIAAQNMNGDTVKVFSLILNIFAVMSAFFGIFLGFKEACQGIATNLLKRFIPEKRINSSAVKMGTVIFGIAICWLAILLNAPVLSFTSISSPIFGIIGCLIPAYLVIKVPSLRGLKSPSLYLIIVVGFLLIISPFLAF